MIPRRKQQLVFLGIGLLAGAALPLAYFLPVEMNLRERLGKERAALESLRKTSEATQQQLEGKVTDAERHTRQAEGMTATLRAQVEEMGAALLDARSGATARTAPRPATRPATAVGADSLPGFPRYRFLAIDPVLRTLDWKALGESYSKMPSLFDQLAQELEEGKPASQLSKSVLQQVQRQEAALGAAAAALARGGVRASSTRGALLHPAVLANSVAAALQVANRPVSGTQSTEIGKLVGSYSKSDERRRSAVDPRTQVFLSSVVGEARARREFLRELWALLTPEQIAVLRPSGLVTGRMQLDLFGEGQIWVGVAQGVEFRRRADLQSKVRAWVMRNGRIPAESLDAAREIVDEWVAALPDDFVEYPANAFTRVGMLDGEHVTECADRVSALLDSLVTRMQLPDDAAARLRGVQSTFVPVLAE